MLTYGVRHVVDVVVAVVVVVVISDVSVPVAVVDSSKQPHQPLNGINKRPQIDKGIKPTAFCKSQCGCEIWTSLSGRSRTSWSQSRCFRTSSNCHSPCTRA